MAENKEYIIHADNRGSINISEDVLTSIAATAALEVEGVASLSAPLTKELVEKLGGKKNIGKGVKVSGDGEGVLVEVYALVKLGYAVNDVAVKIQESVSSAVESMTGFTVKAVNVNICGITLDK